MKKKESFYFSHDMDARHDPKILKMESVYEHGYGWYFKIVEILRAQSEYRYKIDKYCWNAIASDLHMQKNTVKKFVEDCIKEFDLFKSDGEYFWSDSLLERMEIKDKKSQIYAENAKKRWGGKGMQLHSKQNAIAEHIKEIKEIKENNISIPFSSFWNIYGKKVGDKVKLEKQWNKLSDAERQAIMEHVPKYVKATPEKKYRKNPGTYLNNHSWLDEIVEYTSKPGAQDIEKLAYGLFEQRKKTFFSRYQELRLSVSNPKEHIAQGIINALPDIKNYDYQTLKRKLEDKLEEFFKPYYKKEGISA